jgi:hypothetical protein
VLPKILLEAVKGGKVDLGDVKTTMELLKADAVVGVQAKFNGDKIESVGITCALCHSTVDDSMMKGIGRRLDGWPNRDLDVGAIVALAPDLSFYQQLLGADRATVEKVLKSWGPGKYDAGLNQDGKASARTASRRRRCYRRRSCSPASTSTPTPVGARSRTGTHGETLFNGKATCARCHVPPLFIEPGWAMHTPDEIGIYSFQADRSPDKMYRTTPLHGLFVRAKGGFYHDGRFADYRAVIDHYDRHFRLSLTQQEKNELIEYLKSL